MTQFVPEQPDDSLQNLIDQHTEERPMYYPRPADRVQRWAIAVIAVLLLIAGLMTAVRALAQAEPTLTFTAATVTGIESVTPSFTWSTQPAASSCSASGDPAWTGTKEPQGTQTLPAVSNARTYTLTCSWAGDSVARLTWVAPTTNTDGSALTNLRGYTIHYGRTADVLSESRTHFFPTSSNANVANLAPGLWFFCVRAWNTADVQSECSNIIAKTLTTATTANRTVGITVNPRPSPPTQLTAQ